MIISHQRSYLFVEIPHTASTAISHELCKYYAGEPILQKHSTYQEFLSIANPEEKNYLAFVGVRNPMDIVVTRYFKRKTDHQGFFTNPQYWRENGGHITMKARREYKFISKTGIDFIDYFKRFYRLPFDSWGSPAPNDFQFVIRYEKLQENFSELLNRLEIKQVRPLPQVNITREKENNYLEFYPPEIRRKMHWVFGSYVNLWGYEFPVDWEMKGVYSSNQNLFTVLRFIRRRIHNF